MNLLDSFDFRLQKWRYQSVLGVKKIVWFYVAVALLALIPSSGIGNVVASVVLPKPNPVVVNPLITDAPNFRIDPSTALSYANNKRGFFVRVSNRIDDRLRNIGYYPWVYRYAIKDINGRTVNQGSATSYLLPNSDAYVVGPIISEQGISFEVSTDTTKSVAMRFDLAQSTLQEIPSIQTSNSSFSVNSNPSLLDISFTLNNSSRYDIGRVDCTFILRNVDQQIIGIGRYSAENMKKSEIRQVKLTYPSPNLGTNTTLEVIPQVNYLDDENIKLNVR